MITQIQNASRALTFVALLFLVIVFAPQELEGQTARIFVGDPFDDYVRILQLGGVVSAAPLLIRSGPSPNLAAEYSDSVRNPWTALYARISPISAKPTDYGIADAEVRAFWNSTVPHGQNDGAVWQGRGATLQASAGTYFRHGPVEISFRPSIIHVQNREFELAVARSDERPQYANPWHPLNGAMPAIDMPQRFGDGGFTKLDLGETGVRVDWRGVIVGVSNESMWWGPGNRNALILSDNAPGIPHAFIGSSRPVNIGIGNFEAQWIWGRLSESKYFDSADTNDVRYITGLVADFELKWLPGLYVGGSRVFVRYIPSDGLPFGEYFLPFQGITKVSQYSDDAPFGNDERDQMLSLFGRWLFPQSGFEVYVEWARNDHNADWRDFLNQPGHSEAFTVGFQNVRRLSGHKLFRLQGELTHLERPKTMLLRASPTYYTHHIVRQGYTHRGQVIGAGIGPGSNSQYIRGDLFVDWGMVGLFGGRFVHDNDALYAVVGDGRDFRRHHIELSFGVTANVLIGDFVYAGEVGVSRHLNRYFVFENDIFNVNLRASIRWLPRK